jgi:NAD(P)-dependent dehydrogenase (short-subunit alcohol dehydrogenase family)
MKPNASVVITGTSSGIGRATALHLDQLGFEVFAGVRRQEDSHRLAGDASDRLVTILLDVTDAASIEAARANVAERLGETSLDGLVNNAGYTSTSPMEFVEIEELRRQFEVNLFGAAAVTRAVERALTDARPKARYPVTREAKLLYWIGPFLTDRLRDAIFGRIVGL